MATTEDRSQNETTVYELGYLILPSVAEDNVSAVVSKLVSIIENAGASRLDSEDPFLEELAYPMSKTIGARKYIVDEAYIGWMKFEAESSVVEALKREVDAVEEVLRSLLIKVPRETTFTFASAREARAAQLAAEMRPVAEAEVAPVEEVVAEPVSETVVE